VRSLLDSDMEAEILQITVIKGPKNGEILVCKPGSKVRIGRVIKDNDFALRDPGISQKQLCFQFVPEAFKWFLSDLDSSNGTILNGSKIQSLVPVSISDGDVIKIGERTELGVKIVSPELLKENEEENGVVKGRRVNTRRGLARGSAKAGSSRDSDKEEVKVDGSRVSVPVQGGKNNAKANLAGVSNEEENTIETLEPNFGPGVMHKMSQEVKVRSQRRKAVKDNTNRAIEEKMKENRDTSALIEETDQSRGVKLRRNPRRGNSSTALKVVDMNRDAGVGREAKKLHIKKNERKGKEIEVPYDEMQKRNDELLLEIEKESGDFDCLVITKEEWALKDKKTVNFSMVTEEEKGETNIGLEEDLEVNCKSGDPFENMTLEQWFDNMEVFLPKVVHDECVNIINILKEKARKFEEFIEAGCDV
jgi:pSer/pThr/pTyr-binding forkhead associated (FHA) protein